MRDRIKALAAGWKPVADEAATAGADVHIARVERIGRCTLYLADCLAVLPDLTPEAGRFDLVTDPPYGINEAAGKSATRRKGGGMDAGLRR